MCYKNRRTRDVNLVVAALTSVLIKNVPVILVTLWLVVSFFDTVILDSLVSQKELCKITGCYNRRNCNIVIPLIIFERACSLEL